MYVREKKCESDSLEERDVGWNIEIEQREERERVKEDKERKREWLDGWCCY